MNAKELKNLNERAEVAISNYSNVMPQKLDAFIQSVDILKSELEDVLWNFSKAMYKATKELVETEDALSDSINSISEEISSVLPNEEPQNEEEKRALKNYDILSCCNLGYYYSDFLDENSKFSVYKYVENIYDAISDIDDGTNTLKEKKEKLATYKGAE